MIDKERVKFILSKKNIITIIVIFVLVFILLVFLDVNLNPYPPKVVFIDKETNGFLDGKVLLDYKYIGESFGGEFTNLPDDFCKKERKIILKINEEQYSWKSFPSDCELNYIIFKVEKEKILERKNITMKFFIKETQELINGTLYFDDELIADIDGEYIIDMDKCNSIRDITLKTETGDIEWKHHTLWCESYDLIEYSTSEDELE